MSALAIMLATGTAATAEPAMPLPPRAPVVQATDSPDRLPDDGAAAARAEPLDATDDDSERQQALVTWQLTIEAPEDLATLLERFLDLSRFQKADAADDGGGGASPGAGAPAAAPGTQPGPTAATTASTAPRRAGIPRGELARLLRAAPAQAARLLETEGYFNARIEASAVGGSEAIDRASAGGQPVQVRLTVQPGPRARVDLVNLEFTGGLAADAEGSHAERAAAARRLIDTLRRRWSLGSGESFSQDAWGEAKSGIQALLRAEGYAQPSWAGTLAQVDAPRNQVRLYLVGDSGPLFRFGEVRYEGLDHVPPAALEALLTFRTGEPLREKALLDFQDRIVKATLFDAVAVDFEPDPASAEAAPITVRVTERPMQQATFGVGISDATGPRLTVEHLHQRLFGFKWQSKTKAQLGDQQRGFSADLTSYPQPGPHRNLIGLALASNEASGLKVTSERVRLGRSQDGERIERLYYFEWQRAFTRSLVDGGGVDDASSLTYNYQWIWRDLDHPILPTRGTSISAEAGVGRSFASADRTGWFGRGVARLTTYWTPGANWYGQARVHIGQVAAARKVDVPFTLLFRTGGDESVRGYGYQTLGPQQADGSSVGGRLLATASAELARPFSNRFPAWWGAVFVDAGNAASSWRTYEPVYGYGLGLRWRSPVGPLRVDLAYGDALRKLRLHLSVGITF